MNQTNQILTHLKSGKPINPLQEEWKDIVGYEGKLQISNFGRVRSLTRYVKHPTGHPKFHKGRILKTGKTKGGYVIFTTTGSTFLLHRMVAKAFIENVYNKPCVNHKDGNKENNHISNLEWVTYSENEKHSYSVLNKKPNPNMKGRIGLLSNGFKPVIAYDHNWQIVSVYESATQAAKYLEGEQGRISTNARGETYCCYGYNFKYISEDEYRQLSAKYPSIKLDKRSRKLSKYFRAA